MKIEPCTVWRYARLSDLRGSSPASLSAAEQAELSHWRDAGRREGWLLARRVARQLILAQGIESACEESSIEICSRDALGRSVRPAVTIDARPASCSLSMSHTPGGVVVALCSTPGVNVGVDLVPGAALSRGLVDTWFTDRERAQLSAEDVLAACRVWAVKEAVYKAVNRSDSFAPRQIEVRRVDQANYSCTYRGIDLGDRCRITVWECDDHVAALAVARGVPPEIDKNLQNSSLEIEFVKI
jgi:phosphopantetheinyl transferase